FVNAYPRGVTEDGSKEAQALVEEMMEPVDTERRGLGVIPDSDMHLQRTAFLPHSFLWLSQSQSRVLLA
ncbi:MAG: hypothetical protein K6F37_04270, partial [Lachnospiraceae bacterium]|nr:hypothetical protein [Lachnospiraceae bacterium]